ncbi:MAG: preprotein translocase subunit SecE [Candidatus Sumerlaeia bacterium]|nr:preprotein translocase subunit SecE [Candidatus Sumerlaeia bacterium]
MAEAAATKPKGFNGFLASTGNYFREVKVEMTKVTWPTKEQVKAYTSLVLVSTAVASVVFFSLDKGLSELVQLILSLIG